MELRDTTDINQLQVPGYLLETDQLIESTGLARAACYIREDIKFTREKKFRTQKSTNYLAQNIYKKKSHFTSKIGIDSGRV